ncbi:MAG: hypothetical protein HRU35_04280 [Rickettsiaceae bacterium]|nr:hypothetical protein [Rickettsiaceae bacterium]
MTKNNNENYNNPGKNTEVNTNEGNYIFQSKKIVTIYKDKKPVTGFVNDNDQIITIHCLLGE